MGGQDVFENKRVVENQRLKLKNTFNCSRTIIDKTLQALMHQIGVKKEVLELFWCQIGVFA